MLPIETSIKRYTRSIFLGRTFRNTGGSQPAAPAREEKRESIYALAGAEGYGAPT